MTATIEMPNGVKVRGAVCVAEGVRLGRGARGSLWRAVAFRNGDGLVYGGVYVGRSAVDGSCVPVCQAWAAGVALGARAEEVA